MKSIIKAFYTEEKKDISPTNYKGKAIVKPVSSKIMKHIQLKSIMGGDPAVNYQYQTLIQAVKHRV